LQCWSGLQPLGACGTTAQSSQQSLSPAAVQKATDPYLPMYDSFSTAAPYYQKVVTVPDPLRIITYKSNLLASEVKDTKNPYIGSVYVGTGNSPETRLEIYTAVMFAANVNWYNASQYLNSQKALNEIAQLLSPFDAYANESQSWLGTNPHAISVFGGENAQQIGYNGWPSTKEILDTKTHIVGSPTTNNSFAAIGSVPVTYCLVATGVTFRNTASSPIQKFPPTEVKQTIYVQPQPNQYDHVLPITGYYNTPGAKC